MLKAARRDFEVANWRLDMSRDFCLLAGETFPGPFGDVLTNGRPNDLSANCLAGSFHSWVAQSVEGIENLSSGCVRYVRTRESVADIDD